VPRGFKGIIKAAPRYDHVFCAGTEAVKLMKVKAGVDAVWVPFACDPEYHYRVNVPPNERRNFASDIAFVGSYYPNRMKVLESVSGLDVKVWGPGWAEGAQGSPLCKKIVSAHIECREWRKIFSEAKIVTVIHYDDGETPCDQASPKLFEALACGSFVLCDRQKDAVELFRDGEHLVFFDGAADLKEKSAYFLQVPDERDRIALSGQREVIKKHTYEHRIKKILDVARGGEVV